MCIEELGEGYVFKCTCNTRKKGPIKLHVIRFNGQKESRLVLSNYKYN